MKTASVPAHPEANATDTSNRIFGGQSKTYGYDLDHYFPAKTRMELLEAYCRPGMDVLDVACANGLYAVRIAETARSVTAIDISQDMLDEGAREADIRGLKNIKFINMNGCDFDFNGQTFDMIFCYASLVVFPDLKGFFESCRRCLKDGGVLIIDIQNRTNLACPHWRKWYAKEGHGHYNAFSKGEITALLNEYGFAAESWMRQGFAEQWKYVPVLNRLSFIDKLIHWGPKFDLDYIISNLWPFSLATNRWYIVARKK
jgi:ubiquinone/menaquinone biosynthesis C-methylase UbiE